MSKMSQAFTGLVALTTIAANQVPDDFKLPQTDREKFKVEGKQYNPRIPTNKDTFDTGRAYAKEIYAFLQNPEVQKFYAAHPELKKPTIPANIETLLKTDTNKVINKNAQWNAKAQQIGDWAAVTHSVMIDFVAVARIEKQQSDAINAEQKRLGHTLSAERTAEIKKGIYANAEKAGLTPPKLGTDPKELRGTRQHKGTLTDFMESAKAEQFGFVRVPLTQNWLCAEQAPTQGYINLPKPPVPGEDPKPVEFTPKTTQAKAGSASLPEFSFNIGETSFSPTREETCVTPFDRVLGAKPTSVKRIPIAFGFFGGGTSVLGVPCPIGCPDTGFAAPATGF